MSSNFSTILKSVAQKCPDIEYKSLYSSNGGLSLILNQPTLECNSKESFKPLFSPHLQHFTVPFPFTYFSSFFSFLSQFPLYSAPLSIFPTHGNSFYFFLCSESEKLVGDIVSKIHEPHCYFRRLKVN